MTTLAAFIDIGIYLLFAALILITLLLLVVILMQRPKNEGLGAAFGAALTDQAFGARTTDVLKKATVILGTLFMLSVLVLTILMNRKSTDERNSVSLVAPEEQAQAQAKAAEAEKSKNIVNIIEEAEQGKQAESQTPENTPDNTPADPDDTPAALAEEH